VLVYASPQEYTPRDINRTAAVAAGDDVYPHDAPQATPRADFEVRDGRRSPFPLVLVMVMASIEATVVASVLPSVTRELWATLPVPLDRSLWRAELFR